VIVDRLDFDNRNDVLTSDTDGDVMVFEVMSATVDSLIWHLRMPVANTYQLGVGDSTVMALKTL
jgi:hypothetical protein